MHNYIYCSCANRKVILCNVTLLFSVFILRFEEFIKYKILFSIIIINVMSQSLLKHI